MASTSDSCSVDEKASLIEQFCSVTGSDKDKASNMLEICSWNLEMAVNMHVDSDCQDNSNGSCSKEDVTKYSGDVDYVRPPIPPSRAVLVEDFSTQYGLRGIKRSVRTVVDGFRDFEAESKWEEIRLAGSSEDGEFMKKRKTLDDIFRPPLDLMHRGSFESAREAGQESKKWLMVNIQDSKEFACQVLNRDVWSNPAVKSIISEHFTFWQVYCDSAEGERYMQFYSPVTFPYVAVIDPRTGEKLEVWNKLDSVMFCDLVWSFLTQNSLPDKAGPSNRTKYVPSLVDVSEEQQIKAAVEASLKEAVMAVDNEDEDESDIETFDSDSESQHAKITEPKTVKILKTHLPGSSSSSSSSADSSMATETSLDWKAFLGPEDDQTTDLVLRLPDGKRERVTWPCTTKIKALILFAAALGYNQASYELVTNYPRKNLSELSPDKTLRDAGLYPREMVFVQFKNSSP